MYGRIGEKIHIREIVFVFFVSSLESTTNFEVRFSSFFSRLDAESKTISFVKL